MRPENWLPIPGYEGRYCVSDHGNVLHMDFKKTGLPGLLKPSPVRGGYLSVELWLGSESKRFTIHRLVMMAFVGPKPDGHNINHIDGNKLNNSSSNLEYVTFSENSKHSFRLGLQCNKGEQHSQARLNEEKVRDIRRRVKNGESKHALAKEFAVSYAAIHYVSTGKRWGHVKEKSEELQ